MTIPNAALLGPVKHWTATLTLDGVAHQLAEKLPTRNIGFTQKRGICQVSTEVFPDVPADAAAVVELTLNGVHTTRFFTGRVGARPIGDLPLNFELGLVDSLARLNKSLEEDVTWSGVGFATAVRQLLNKAGIVDAEIAGIFDPGADFVLGPKEPITIAKGGSIGDTLDTLLTFGGCGLFVEPDGRIRVADAPGWPGETTISTPVYAFGATTSEFGFLSSRRTIADAESVISKFTAKGPRLKSKTIADATFTLSGVSGRTVTETYAYLQTDAAAKAIARREIVRRNRASTEVDVEAPLNPNLRPGETILFRHPELGFPTNTAAIVVGMATRDDTMTLTISVGPKPAEGTLSVIPPPSPNFTAMYETQPVMLAGALATAVVVECKDTSTDPSGFEITSRQWTAACEGDVQPQPSSSSELNPIFIFPTLNGATVTLAVESSSGEGNEVTKPITPAPGEQFTRSLSVAAGSDGWKVLAGSFGWRAYTAGGACTAVPGINDKGPMLAGFSDGKLMLTDDFLASAPELLFQFPSQVNCIFVNEGNPAHILVGAGSLLAVSQDSGVSWTPLLDAAEDIRYVESSPSNPNEIRLCVGNVLFMSFDGVTFSPLLTGAPGTTCRKVASAPWGHLAVWTGATNLTDAWQFEEGHSIDWSAVPAEHLPTDLATVTPLQYEEGYLVAAGEAADIVRDGLFGQLCYLANAGTTTKLYKLVNAGGVFTATYISQTTMGGPHKVVNHGGAFPIDNISAAYGIGYGQPTDTPLPPELVVLPYELTGPGDQLWHYKPLLGWTPRALPVSAGRWRGIAIHPIAYTQWLIWTDQQIFLTLDSGVTWVEVYHHKAPGGLHNHEILDAIFIGLGNVWLLSVVHVSFFGASRSTQGYLAVGDGAVPLAIVTNGDSITKPAPSSPNLRVPIKLVRGVDGDVFAHVTTQGAVFPEFSLNRVYADKWGIIDPASLQVGIVGETPYVPWALRDATGASRQAYGTWSSNVGMTRNYAGSTPDPLIAGGGSVAACDAGIFLGNRDGIAQITNIDVLPALQVVAGGGQPVGPIATGSRRRGAAARTVNKVHPADQPTAWRIYAWNGTQWGSVETPDGLTNISEALGVVEP